MLLTNSLIYDLIGILVALLVVVIAYFKWTFTYWKRRGLEGPEPSIPFGNMTDLFRGKKALGEVWKDIYFELKAKGLPHGGGYLCALPIYLPTDLDIIKAVLINDFQHFLGHGAYVNEHKNPLSAHIFNLEGPKWKAIRSKVTPTFTSGKLKMMFQTMADCSAELEKLLDRSCNSNPADVKEIVACFTTDIFVSCAFGLDSNSMENPNSEFRKYGRIIFEMNTIRSIKAFAQFFMPHWFLRAIDFQNVSEEITNFFVKMVSDTISYREKNNIVRRDFMHLLIQLKNRGALSDDGKLTDGENKGILSVPEITAQTYIFFLGGFETASTAVTFATYELAVNPNVQEKAREEVRRVLAKHNNTVTYDAVMEMIYVENVINEALRRYPPAQMLFRKCSEDYKVPGSDLVIEKGTPVIIPVYGIHHDPEYYPDPYKFDPDRFNEENKKSRPQFTFLPFGEGPRICIGMRFGILQSKLALITLLKDYKLTLNKKTKTPVKLSTRGLVFNIEGGLWIDIEKIQT